MKQWISLLFAALAVFALVGCSPATDYSANAKEFSKSGMTLTLTEEFRELSYEGYTACYESQNVAVYVFKEPFSAIPGSGNMPLTDYANLVRENNASSTPTPIMTKNGLTYMEYDSQHQQTEETYASLCAMYKGSDAFWLIQFVCDKTEYEVYRPYFIAWAGSADFS